MTKIAFGCDHAGYILKAPVLAYLTNAGYEVVDFGTHSEASVDYPDFAHPVAYAVEGGEVDLGILCCGSGNGVAITANKHQGIRAALCWLPELATLAREHNNANILCMPGRYVTGDEAVEMVKAFLAASFEGGRHARRVGKMSC
ncbi:MAG TPA: ribose 5-phosphate isomerase B [Saprospiraceae bacterium]|nr:ribose 5-phosphate isomerase B [Saprospiraceae bacterium]